MKRQDTPGTDACFAPGMIGVDAALAFLLERARPVAELEWVETAAALGRVVARSHLAAIDVPGHDNSAMDGYALRSADVPGDGAVRLSVAQRIAAGEVGRQLGVGEAARIFTGAPIPPGADAVVMQEHCEADDDGVLVRGPVAPGAWVRPRGNDITAGTGILAPGVRMRPQEMGLAASVGLARLEVFRRLRVAIFSSGDELVAPGEALGEGCIYNSNRYTLHGLLAGLGCEVLDLGTVEDRFETTRDTLRRAAADADVVVTTGGVSVGEEDHIKRAVESAGSLDLWRISVKPGKPLAYGRVQDCDFLGLPGNPVSVFVTFCLFVRPFLMRRQGGREVQPPRLRVRAGFRWSRPGDRREFVRARLEGGEAGETQAAIYPKQGSDVLTSAVWAQGLVEIPEGTTVEPGDLVTYLSFADLVG